MILRNLFILGDIGYLNKNLCKVVQNINKNILKKKILIIIIAVSLSINLKLYLYMRIINEIVKTHVLTDNP